MRTGDDEHDHDVVDEEDQLDDEKHEVGHEPGQQLHGGLADCAEVEENVGDQEEADEDELNDDGLVPAGGEEPLGDAAHSHELQSLQEGEDQDNHLEPAGVPEEDVHGVVMKCSTGLTTSHSPDSSPW